MNHPYFCSVFYVSYTYRWIVQFEGKESLTKEVAKDIAVVEEVGEVAVEEVDEEAEEVVADKKVRDMNMQEEE